MQKKLYMIPIVILICLLLPFYAVFIGYVTTIVCIISLAALIISIFLCRTEINSILSKHLNKYSILALLFILIFFISFSTLYLKQTELIFFDENIYQSVAVNIINHGNAQICWYGTAQLKSCFYNQLGFDPAGTAFVVAIAFEIFGVGTQTAYALELCIGALSIVAVFLLSSVLTNRKELGVMTALIFALMPELFVWTKTQADPNMTFMLFATLTAFFFMIFIKKTNKKTLTLFTFSLIFTIYTRIEAIFLIPIFIIGFFTLTESNLKKTFNEKVKLAINLEKKLVSDRYLLALFVLFLVLIEPEIYVMIVTSSSVQNNAAFYLGQNIQTFSLSNFIQNIAPNASYLLGLVKIYPIIFLPNVTVFAAIGILALLLYKKYPNRLGILALFISMVLGYLILYGFYWSGSALSGTSGRFMLIIFPSLSVLAAIGILCLGDLITSIIYKKNKASDKNIRQTATYAIYALILLAVFIIPFVYSIPFLTHPNYNYDGYPTNYTTGNPQTDPYSMIYPNKSLSFIYQNYNKVPSGCLVFSLAPYLWYGLNRSAVIPQLYNAPYPDLKNYSCYVFDYDYWCTINTFKTGICNTILTNYNVKVLATENGTPGSNFTLYQILNYTPT